MNPRTKNREVPAGVVSVGSVWALLILAYGIFIYSAAMLGVHTLMLAIPVLVILSFYSWTKRFTSYSHIFLGLALALAPGGVWYALVGTVEMLPIWLMLGVLFWVAGFDILYSCQDEAFDRASGLHSIPAALGVRGALYTAVALHLTSIGLLVLLGVTFDRGPVYFAGVFVFAAILASQYRSIYRHGIQCIDQVFFTRNGLASIGFFIAVVADSLA
jgi:4-hydroxybenzoate polyprenyltransferase